MITCSIVDDSFRSSLHSPVGHLLRNLSVDHCVLIRLTRLPRFSALGLFVAVRLSSLSHNPSPCLKLSLENHRSGVAHLPCFLPGHCSMCVLLISSREDVDLIKSLVYVNSLLASLNMRSRLSKRDLATSIGDSTKTALHIRTPSGIKVDGLILSLVQ